MAAKRQESEYRLKPGESIVLEGKYGLISVSCFGRPEDATVRTVIHTDARTDAKRGA